MPARRSTAEARTFAVPLRRNRESQMRTRVTVKTKTDSSSRTRAETVSGEVTITGLRAAMSTWTSETSYDSPLLDDGRWQIRVVVHSAETASLDFMAKKVNGEKLNADGTRPGLFKAFIRTASQARNWTTSPLQSWMTDTSYRFEDWIKKVDLDYEDQLNIGVLSGRPLLETDVYTVRWSIETNPLTASVGHVPWSSDSNVIMKLFDEESASDVVFAIRSHLEGSEREQLIYAHTMVLCARSNYFKTMFKSGFSESYCSWSGSTSAGNQSGAVEMENFEDSDNEDNQRPARDDSTKPTPAPFSLAQAPSMALNRARLSSKKIVHIVNASYHTYYAMLYYLYTKAYAFMPLSSDVGSPEAREHYRTLNTRVISPSGLENVPISSAKSMYRLCDRLEILQLKAAAFDHIKQSLTPQNIIAELSSVFTSNFAEVQQLQTEYLISHWKEITASAEFMDYFGTRFAEEPLGVKDVWIQAFQMLPVGAL